MRKRVWIFTLTDRQFGQQVLKAATGNFLTTERITLEFLLFDLAYSCGIVLSPFLPDVLFSFGRSRPRHARRHSGFRRRFSFPGAFGLGPAALWLLLNLHQSWGLFLVVYSIIFISEADHIIRLAFIAHGAQLPYLLTVLDILDGVVSLGGLSIFLDPVLLGVGHSLTTEFACGDDQSKKRMLQ